MGGADPLFEHGRRILFMILLTAAAGGHAAPYRFEDGAYLGAASLMPDFSDMLARREAELPEFRRCLNDPEPCNSRYRSLRHVLDKAAELSEHKQLSLINRYVNKRRYKDDRTATLTTGLSDEALKYRSRWATPVEFLIRGGDCEDFATTKYFLLRELGIGAERLRIVVTWDRRSRGYHAVLAVLREDGDVWLLESDNRIYRKRHLDYRYIYAVNETAVWDHEQPARIDQTAQQRAPEKPTEANL